MSIVAWDGKTVVADKQATYGELPVRVTKIRKISTGEILAWTGDAETGQLMASWYENGADIDKYPEFQNSEDWARLVVVSKRGLKTYEKFASPIVYEEPFAAFGSGRDFALAAMEMGANAERAVEVACKYCVSCGLGFDVFEVEDSAP